jgi:hypothetical protein
MMSGVGSDVNRMNDNGENEQQQQQQQQQQQKQQQQQQIQLNSNDEQEQQQQLLVTTVGNDCWSRPTTSTGYSKYFDYDYYCYY